MKSCESRLRNVPVELHGDGRFVVSRSEFTPAYVRTFETGRLAEKARQAKDLLRCCRVCPRECEANRAEGELGICQIGRCVRVSSAFPHLGEEDCIRGTHGSGAMFFSGCNLRCVFCQNYEISHLVQGSEITARDLARLMLELQSARCHNINFVTPSHVAPQLIEALLIAVERGLRLPIVYNTGAYDSPEILRLMDGVVDIYMPDFKLWHAEHCQRYLTAVDYADVARAALELMHRQVGDLIVDEDGVALRGLLVRHLVMPGLLDDTRKIMNWLARALSPDTFVNVMDQFHPAWMLESDPRFCAARRHITPAEFDRAMDSARQAGLWRFDTRWRNRIQLVPAVP